MPSLRNGNGGRGLPKLRISGDSKSPRFTQVNLDAEKETVMRKLSVYLSYLLRHHPEDAGLDMDTHGWVSVDDLIEGVNGREKYTLDRNRLERLVAEDSKGRYRFNEDHSRIKRCQGHSIPLGEPGTDLGTSAEVSLPRNDYGCPEKDRGRRCNTENESPCRPYARRRGPGVAFSEALASDAGGTENRCQGHGERWIRFWNGGQWSLVYRVGANGICL